MVDTETEHQSPPGYTAGPHLLTTSRAGCVRPGPQFKVRSDGATSRLSTQSPVSSLSFPSLPGQEHILQEDRATRWKEPGSLGTSDGRHIPPAMGLYMRDELLHYDTEMFRSMKIR